MKKMMLAAAVLSLAVSARAQTAVAKIKGTIEGSRVDGLVTLTDTAKGLHVSGRISGLPPGLHGFHIHEFGSCEDIGRAAGGHYNPMDSSHGHAVKDGIKKAHAGDLGNITVGEDGTAVIDAVIARVKVAAAKYAVAGRAIIVHEKADDFGQPVGNAGGRIACGVIGIAAEALK